jgi:hypothetical protein
MAKRVWLLSFRHQQSLRFHQASAFSLIRFFDSD